MNIQRIALIFVTVTLAAQVQDARNPPAFDVVSIHMLPPNSPPGIREVEFTPVMPGGQFIDSHTNLIFMIALAYNVRNPGKLLIGLPGWTKGQVYSIAAKPAPDFPRLSPAENEEQVRLMLRAMLADRFHLKVDAETRREPIFNLEVAKGGIRIKEVDPPVPPAKPGPVFGYGENNNGGRLIASKSTMAGLAIALDIATQRPVLDRTGLDGYYDFDVKWSGPPPADGQPSVPAQFGGAEYVGGLISALESQLGLRVTSGKGPVEYWLVDHIEPPTTN